MPVMRYWRVFRRVLKVIQLHDNKIKLLYLSVRALRVRLVNLAGRFSVRPASFKSLFHLKSPSSFLT